MNAQLKRLDSQPYGVFGFLHIDGSRRRYVTAELPSLGNAKSISCIPAGKYAAMRYWSPIHKREVFQVMNVPARDMIEIHIGNVAQTDSKGCILIGLGFDLIDTKGALHPGVIASTMAFKQFMEELKGVNEFQLLITEAV